LPRGNGPTGARPPGEPIQHRSDRAREKLGWGKKEKTVRTSVSLPSFQKGQRSKGHQKETVLPRSNKGGKKANKTRLGGKTNCCGGPVLKKKKEIGKKGPPLDGVWEKESGKKSKGWQ